MPEVLIAGSRALPRGQAGRLLIRFLADLPTDTTILLRRGINSPVGHFEQQVEGLCDLVGLRVEWVEPQPGGRMGTFERDLQLVMRADLILAFYTLDQIEDDTSGTVALVRKAYERERVVYAYALHPFGDDWSVLRVGEHDPKNVWAEKVPAPR